MSLCLLGVAPLSAVMHNVIMLNVVAGTVENPKSCLGQVFNFKLAPFAKEQGNGQRIWTRCSNVALSCKPWPQPVSFNHFQARGPIL
jgi:hypothetical protein